MKDLRFYGKMITADFDENTMTFEIENEMVVQAGDYVILTLKDYAELVNGVEKSTEPALNMQNVINSGLPEWLDEETRVKALILWDAHKSTEDDLRVKAVKVIQKRAADAGYTITMRKGMELFKSHCL